MSIPRSVPPVACMAVGTSRHASEASGFVPVDVRGHVHVRGVHAYMCVCALHVEAHTHMHVRALRACMLHVHVHVRASKCACTRNGLEVSMIEPRAPYCVEVNAVLAPPRPLPLPLPV